MDAASLGFNACVSVALWFVKLPEAPAGEWPDIAKVAFAAGERDTFYGGSPGSRRLGRVRGRRSLKQITPPLSP